MVCLKNKKETDRMRPPVISKNLSIFFPHLCSFVEKYFGTIMLQAGGSALSLFFTAYLARNLGAAGFGSWVVSRNLIDLMVAVALFSIPQYILYLGTSFFQKSIELILAWLLVSVFIMSIFLIFGKVSILIASAFFVLLLNNLIRPIVLLRSQMSFALFSIFSWGGALAFATVLRVHHHEQALISYAFGFFVPAIFALAFFLKKAKPGFRVKFNLFKESHFIKYNIVVFAANISQNFVFWLVTKLVSVQSTPDEAGLLGVALFSCFSVALLPITYLAPFFQKDWSQNKHVPKFANYWKIILLINLVAIAIIPIIDKIIFKFLGTPYLSAKIPVAILFSGIGIFYLERMQLLVAMSTGSVLPIAVGLFIRISIVAIGSIIIHAHNATTVAILLVVSYGLGCVFTELVSYSRRAITIGGETQW